MKLTQINQDHLNGSPEGPQYVKTAVEKVRTLQETTFEPGMR